MTLLGWIHDLGYLTGRADTHAPDLGRLLEAEGYAYAGAAGRHGTDRIDYDDPADVLLNIADMSVTVRAYSCCSTSASGTWPAGRHVPPYHVAAIHVHGWPVRMRIHADDEPPMRPAPIVVERHMPPQRAPKLHVHVPKHGMGRSRNRRTPHHSQRAGPDTIRPVHAARPRRRRPVRLAP